MKTHVFIILFLSFPLLMTSQMPDVIHFTVDFEEQSPWVEFNPDSTDIWQVGQPMQLCLDSAYSPVNGVMTDALNNYPVLNHSYFDVKLGEFNMGLSYMYILGVRFQHKFDTDTLLDGGYVSLSLDNGDSWDNVIEMDMLGQMYSELFSDYNVYSSSDSLFGGQKGWSGKSDGWITTSLRWAVYPVFAPPSGELANGGSWLLPDTMLMRFNFISDSIHNPHEGWLIDHLEVYSFDVGGNVGDIIPTQFKIFPNPAQDYITIETDVPARDLSLRVVSNEGRIVSELIQLPSLKVDVKGLKLNPGLYHFQLFQGNNSMGSEPVLIE